jgi:hypothetical protein
MKKGQTGNRFGEEVRQHVVRCRVGKGNVRVVDYLLNEVELDLNMFQATGVAICVAVCNRNTALIVLVNNDGIVVGCQSNLKEKLFEPEELPHKIDE